MAHENVEKDPHKVGYFSKIPKNVSTALTVQSAPKQKKYHEIHLKFYSVYLGYITLVPTQLNNLRDEPMSLRYCEK